jgi:hypothetical protein
VSPYCHWSLRAAYTVLQMPIGTVGRSSDQQFKSHLSKTLAYFADPILMFAPLLQTSLVWENTCIRLEKPPPPISQTRSYHIWLTRQVSNSDQPFVDLHLCPHCVPKVPQIVPYVIYISGRIRGPAGCHVNGQVDLD